ncbi:MAG: hypothetical protein HY432_01355 [Candidatus Liptonbacteria bacterium]|nr:hypothetical protein [Candidatus Liptonbacteria bacterium]
MFCGKHDAAVDCKWRLNLPAELKGEFEKAGNECMFAMADNGCVRMCPFTSTNGHDKPDYKLIDKGNIAKNKKNGSSRITIPEMFRDSVSFHFGNTVTVVGMGNYIELWPRPSGHRQ